MILIVDDKGWTLFELPTLTKKRLGSGSDRLPARAVSVVGLIVRSLGDVPIVSLDSLKSSLGRGEQDLVKKLRQAFKKTPIWLVSDDYFFRSLPIGSSANLVSFENKRRGIHGLTHSYLSTQAAKKLGQSLLELNLISVYLDEQSSIAAIKNGAALEISSSSVLDGLPGAHSSGSIDLEETLALVEKVGLTKTRQLLTNESGLLGFSGIKKQLDQVLSNPKLRQSPKFTLALKIYMHRLILFLGAYSALLGRVDVVVFSGKIGTESAFIREGLTSSLGVFRSANILSIPAEPHLVAAELIYHQG